jgi:glutamine synthetase
LLDHYHPESGHGQQELVFKAADPLTACDRILLARETVRSVAWTHGWYASFAARPFEAQPPSGMHAHLSLWDRHDENLMYKPEQQDDEDMPAHAMQDEARRFVAGMMRHLPALTALACPTVNSYRRLQAQAPVSPYVAWGYDNRQTMIRMVPLAWSEKLASANMEFKLPDGSANPYLMMGALIAAGLDGLANGYELPAPVQSSPNQLDAETRESMGIEPLPASLPAACEALEKDEALGAALGSRMLDTYLALKAQEAKTFEGVAATIEQTRHYWKF